MVIDGDATSVEERLPPGPSQPAPDFSNLQGFQFVGARDGVASHGGTDDEQRRAALALELDARAARFHQAVDSSIVLASDGTIRWLGDSVAKLAPGQDILAPRTILFVDEAMSAEAQTLVVARLELWLSATIQRLLGPLFSLRGLQEGSSQLQDLAVRIANAFGVLDREPVRTVVRGLDQNARGVLRKQGVRFGSYYLYVPSTLRPASRALALQLWCVQKGDEELSAAAQGLIPMASSGRTSAPPDARVNPETYRIGGFRSCGDRVVRVDIVERLADMIRAASVLRVVNGSDSGPLAFQVTSQMTSLTGCSGDGFSSVLRALGFESLTVQRNEIVWPAAATPAAPPPATSEAPGPESEGAEPKGASADQGNSAEATGQAESREPAGAAAEAIDAADPQGAPLAEADLSAQRAPPDDVHPWAIEAPEPATRTGPAEAPLPDAPAEIRPAPDLPTEAPQDTAPPALEASAPEPSGVTDPAEAPSDPCSEIRPSADFSMEAPPQEAQEAKASSAENETVTVWRFARTPNPRQPKPHHRQARRRVSTADPQRAPLQPGAGASSGEAAAAAIHAESAAPKTGRPATVGKPAREGGQKTWGSPKTPLKPDERRDGRSSAGGRPGGERRPVVDPMSPFAKLMELRSILESESKKRT